MSRYSLWCSVAIFLTLESKFVQYTTSYMQLFPFKITFFFNWNATISTSGFLMFDAFSLCSSASSPPPVLNKHHCFQILHVCYWSPSVVCALFPCWCLLRCSSAGEGKQTCDSRGSKVNVSFSCVVRFVVDRCVRYTELIVKGHASGEMTVCTTRCYPAGAVKSA